MLFRSHRSLKASESAEQHIVLKISGNSGLVFLGEVGKTGFATAGLHFLIYEMGTRFHILSAA